MKAIRRARKKTGCFTCNPSMTTAGPTAGAPLPRGRRGDSAACRVSLCNARLIALRGRAPPNVKSAQPVPWGTRHHPCTQAAIVK